MHIRNLVYSIILAILPSITFAESPNTQQHLEAYYEQYQDKYNDSDEDEEEQDAWEDDENDWDYVEEDLNEDDVNIFADVIALIWKMAGNSPKN